MPWKYDWRQSMRLVNQETEVGQHWAIADHLVKSKESKRDLICLSRRPGCLESIAIGEIRRCLPETTSSCLFSAADRINAEKLAEITRSLECHHLHPQSNRVHPKLDFVVQALSVSSHYGCSRDILGDRSCPFYIVVLHSIISFFAELLGYYQKVWGAGRRGHRSWWLWLEHIRPQSWTRRQTCQSIGSRQKSSWSPIH